MASRNGEAFGTDVILPQAFGIMVGRAVSSPHQTWAAIIGKVMDLTYWASFVFTASSYSSSIESRCLNLHNLYSPDTVVVWPCIWWLYRPKELVTAASEALPKIVIISIIPTTVTLIIHKISFVSIKSQIL